MTKDELITAITNANAAYAQGIPYLTDSEYDILWKQLYKLDSKCPYLYHTGNDDSLPFNELRHKTQLYGTNKAFDMEDLKPFLTRFGNETLLLEPKYDGLAAVLYIGEHEPNDTLILEGNGIKGRDISHHVQHLFGTFEPSGAMNPIEIIIPRKNWSDSYGSNPRNTAAGWIASKDISPHHHVMEMVSHNNGNLQYPYNYSGNLDDMYEILLQCFNEWSALYPLDGIMIKVMNEKRRLVSGHNGTTYSWSIAWKPPIQTAKTTVTNIEWNVSRSGRVIPTVVYNPVELCDTINKRVTGNNAKWLLDSKIIQKCNITIGKAGEIIPKILSVDPNTVNNPLDKVEITFCPKCQNQLKWKGVDLICDSPDCIAQLIKSLSYFYSDKGMEVKTIGEYMIADLLENETIYQTLKDKPWALLDPIEYNIYTIIHSIWGIKKTNNYMDSLNQIKSKKNCIHFMSALGLPGLAYRTAMKLFYYIRYGKTFTSVSQKAMSSFNDAFILFHQAEKEMNNFHFDLVPQLPTVTYCITGTLSQSRDDFIKYLSTKGWQFTNQVSKSTDYLIIGSNPGKTKLTSAKQKNIKTITEDQLPTLIKKDT